MIKKVSASAIAKTPVGAGVRIVWDPTIEYHPWLYLRTPNAWWLALVREERQLGRRMTAGELAGFRERLESRGRVVRA